MLIFIKINVLYKALKNPHVLQNQLSIRNFSKKGCSLFGFQWSSSSYCCIDSFKCTKPVLEITIFYSFCICRTIIQVGRDLRNTLVHPVSYSRQCHWEKDPLYIQSEPSCFNSCPLSLILLPCTMVKDNDCTGVSPTVRITSETFSPKIINH